MSAKAKKENAPETWRDRLVEVRKMRAGDVLPHPLNPKNHPPAQTEPLAALLREVGKVDTLRAYYSERNDGKLTYWDGHARDNLNQDELWNVAIYDIHDSEADKLVASFDPLAALAEMESAKLEALLQNISTGEPALQQMLAELAADSGLSYGAQEPAKSQMGASQLGDMEYRVVVACEGEEHQSELLARFESEGLNCQALIS